MTVRAECRLDSVRVVAMGRSPRSPLAPDSASAMGRIVRGPVPVIPFLPGRAPSRGIAWECSKAPLRP